MLFLLSREKYNQSDTNIKVNSLVAKNNINLFQLITKVVNHSYSLYDWIKYRLTLS